MPRTAFAIPCATAHEASWRRDAAWLLDEGATAHRAHLAGRGITRERVWLQSGGAHEPLTLVLWDCTDAERARAPVPTDDRHQRWLHEIVMRRYHGLDHGWGGTPAAELIAGVTVEPTALAGGQALIALPVPTERADLVRDRVRGWEDGPGAADHADVLGRLGIREEWAWLQPATERCAELVLLHWIGDDLDGAWGRLAGMPEGQAPALRGLLADLGLRAEQVAGWRAEQVVNLHVRRGDERPSPSDAVAARIAVALSGRRWHRLQRTLRPAVRLHGRVVAPAEVIAHLRALVEGRELEVVEVLSGGDLVAATMQDPAGRLVAICFEAEPGGVCAVRLLEEAAPPAPRSSWTAAEEPRPAAAGHPSGHPADRGT